MSQTPAQSVSLRIIIESPPPGIRYGLQRGSGTSYETEQAQLSKGDDLQFELTLPVKVDKEGNFVFSGPFAQGTPKERFLYIGMGSYAGQKDGTINGRLKVPLPELSEHFLVYLERGEVLTARFPGTDAKTGRPKMASVMLEDGWVLAS